MSVNIKNEPKNDKYLSNINIHDTPASIKHKYFKLLEMHHLDRLSCAIDEDKSHSIEKNKKINSDLIY